MRKKIVIKADSKLSKDVVSSYGNKSIRDKELKVIADETITHWAYRTKSLIPFQVQLTMLLEEA